MGIKKKMEKEIFKNGERNSRLGKNRWKGSPRGIFWMDKTLIIFIKWYMLKLEYIREHDMHKINSNFMIKTHLQILPEKRTNC